MTLDNYTVPLSHFAKYLRHARYSPAMSPAKCRILAHRWCKLANVARERKKCAKYQVATSGRHWNLFSRWILAYYNDGAPVGNSFEYKGSLFHRLWPIWTEFSAAFCSNLTAIVTSNRFEFISHLFIEFLTAANGVEITQWQEWAHTQLFARRKNSATTVPVYWTLRRSLGNRE